MQCGIRSCVCQSLVRWQAPSEGLPTRQGQRWMRFPVLLEEHLRVVTQGFAEVNLDVVLDVFTSHCLFFFASIRISYSPHFCPPMLSIGSYTWVTMLYAFGSAVTTSPEPRSTLTDTTDSSGNPLTYSSSCFFVIVCKLWGVIHDVFRYHMLDGIGYRVYVPMV